MASNYLNRVALDNDTTLPDGPFTEGVSTGNLGHSQNRDQAIKTVEGYLGIAGGSPTTTPPGGGAVLLSTSSGQSDWAAPPAGTPSGTVVAPSAFSTSPAAGSASAYSRGDHSHGLPGPVKEIVFTFDTVTSPTVGTYKYRLRRSATLLSIRCSLGTVAAAGAACVVDVNKNGTSMMSAGKPSITVGQAINTNSQTFSTTAFAADDLVSCDIDTGSDGFQLMVIVEYQENTP